VLLSMPVPAPIPDQQRNVYSKAMYTLQCIYLCKEYMYIGTFVPRTIIPALAWQKVMLTGGTVSINRYIQCSRVETPTEVTDLISPSLMFHQVNT